MSKVPPSGAMTVSFGEVCDRGKVREENQDNVRGASIPLGDLFLVADGIGGYQGGATASRMVVDGFHNQLASRPAGYSPEQALHEACTYTNASIYNAGQAGDPSLQRMGSTVVMALIQASTQSAWIGHVGDSRAYLIRNGEMIKLTSDHSAVQALLSRNLITEEEARNHPDSSVLTRSLGHRPEVEMEVDRVSLQMGDALLLCSDGLWGYVAEDDIAAVVIDASLSVQTIANTLLHQALAAGGHDNIGIEFIRIEVGASNLAMSLTAAGGILNSQRVHTPDFSGNSAMVERRTTRAHKQQILAIMLLLLGGCGYLAYAIFSHNWPFSHGARRGGRGHSYEGLDRTQGTQASATAKDGTQAIERG